MSPGLLERILGYGGLALGGASAMSQLPSRRVGVPGMYTAQAPTLGGYGRV